MAKTKKFDFSRTIEAMVIGESNNWSIARALVDELVPSGPRNEIPKAAYVALADAQTSAGLEAWEYTKARNYRRTAAMFGASDMVAGLSWGGHYAATNAGTLAAAKNAIQAVGNSIDSDNPLTEATMRRVTVAKVRAHVRTLAGKGKGKGKRRAKSGKVGTLSIAAVAALAGKVRNKANFVAPLVKNGNIASLQASLATVEAFTAWLSEAINEATGKAGSQPANIAKAPKGKALAKAPAKVRQAVRGS